MKVYDKSGHVLTLEEPPIGSGGEGSVYVIRGYNRVAKIYSDNAASHQAKIEAMASLYGSISALPALKDIAWPLAPLYSDKVCSHFVGFGMRRISRGGRLGDLYAYNPGSANRISMRERIDFLIELARMVDALHGLGQVIGDFNDNNIPVLPGGHAALVDADSFHVTVGGRLFKCEVCKSGYVAPEVIRNTRGTSYAAATKETFTKATDDFSLAVHVFKMLFNGVHPFHCVSLPDKSGSVPAAIPTEKRVERGETPFFRSVPGVKLPDFAPHVSDFPDYLVGCFRRAFVSGRTNPSARPTAAEWAKVLIRYRADLTMTCKNPGHAHWRGTNGCPYCAADKRFGKVAQTAGLPTSTGFGGSLFGMSTSTLPTKQAILGHIATFKARVNTAKTSFVSAITPKMPGSLRCSNLSKTQYWLLTLAGSAVAGIIASNIVSALVFYEMCGWTPTLLMVAPLVVAGVIVTSLFNTYYASKDDGRTIGIAISSSLVGVVLVTLLYLFCVYLLPYFVAGSLLIFLIAGMFDLV